MASVPTPRPLTTGKPKLLNPESVTASDVVITMGCGDTRPAFPGMQDEDRELADPAGQGLDTVRGVRDDICRRVPDLLGRLEIPVSAP